MRLRLFPLLFLAACLVRAAEPSTATPAAAAAGDAKVFLLAAKYTNTLTLEPGTDDGLLAKTVGSFLQNSHYTRHKFDRELGEKMFDRYLDALDPQKLYFLQSDLAEFAPVRAALDDLTLRQGDTTAAYDIFNRFLKRFDQSYALVIDHLQSGRFTFTADESYLVNRKDAARPKDLAEARKLWPEQSGGAGTTTRALL